MARTAISGFPEWLPQERSVELQVVDRLRRVFETHGFVNVETRSVEPLGALEAKGETSKEIYLLSRLQSQRESSGSVELSPTRTLGLHFDLTVPLARYVVENSGSLIFPFRRYQMQKVWRGERPQEGRFREFTQADIDIVGQGELAWHHDAEAAQVMLEALASLNLGEVVMQVNNRRLLQAVLEAHGVSDIPAALRALDKFDKVGAEGVAKELAELGLGEEESAAVLRAAAITAVSGAELRTKLEAAGLDPEQLEPGLSELSQVLDAVEAPEGTRFEAALRIARGLDYYTGTVYETVLPGHESFGSICSGGRYDQLAISGKRTFPGVGLSIGVTRLVALMLSSGLGPQGIPTPTKVLVLVNDEDSRAASEEVARTLRGRGIPTEVSPSAQKYGRQIRYADRKGIPYVWFVQEQGGAVKDIRTGDQVDASPQDWSPLA